MCELLEGKGDLIALWQWHWELVLEAHTEFARLPKSALNSSNLSTGSSHLKGSKHIGGLQETNIICELKYHWIMLVPVTHEVFREGFSRVVIARLQAKLAVLVIST